MPPAASVRNELLLSVSAGAKAAKMEQSLEAIGLEVVAWVSPRVLQVRSDKYEAGALARLIEGLPGIEAIQPNFLYRLTRTPRESGFRGQWALGEVVLGGMGAEDAWERSPQRRLAAA